MVSNQSVYARPDYLAVNPSSTSVIVGSSTTIYVNVSVTSLYGCEFKVSYNSAIFNVTSITNGTFFSVAIGNNNVFITDEINNTGGYVAYSIFLLAPEVSVTGDGILFNITGTGVTVGTTNIEIYDDILGDENSTAIVHSVYNGTLTVSSSSSGVDSSGSAGSHTSNNKEYVSIFFMNQLVPSYSIGFGIDCSYSISLQLNGSSYSGDAIIDWNLTKQNITVINGTAIVPVHSLVDFNLTFGSLPEGKYTLYCYIESIGYSTIDKMISMNFTVGNVYINYAYYLFDLVSGLAYEYYYITVPIIIVLLISIIGIVKHKNGGGGRRRRR